MLLLSSIYFISTCDCDIAVHIKTFIVFIVCNKGILTLNNKEDVLNKAHVIKTNKHVYMWEFNLYTDYAIAVIIL